MKWRYEFRNRLNESATYQYIRAVTRDADSVRVRRDVTPGSALVLDGFPRCGNTYAFFSICKVNDCLKGRVANHIHSSTQFLWARKYKIPAILLIREPLECVASLSVFAPTYPIESLLDWYILFHERVYPYRDAFVASSFNTTTKHLGKVVEVANERFGMQLILPPNGQEHELAVKQEVNNHYLRLDKGSQYQVHEGMAALPKEEKVAGKDLARRHLQARSNVKRMTRARQAYERIRAECI